MAAFLGDTATWKAAELQPGQWPQALDLCLFESITRYRPVGIHAHVNMVLVRLELLSRVPDLTSEHIWAHLQELYDLDRLNDGEGPDWSSYAEGEEGSRALRESGDEDEDNEEGTSYSLDFTLPEEWLDNIGSSAAAEETGASRSTKRKRG